MVRRRSGKVNRHISLPRRLDRGGGPSRTLATACDHRPAGIALDEDAESPGYLTRQLITCLGNKRALLPGIEAAVMKVRRRLGRTRLRILDAFSGSGSVSRLFKRHARYLAVNDLEDYAAVAARCYLRNRSTVDDHRLTRLIADLNAAVERRASVEGFHRGALCASR